MQYSVVDGEAIVEGDIILGPAQLVEQATADLQSGRFTEGVGITGTQFRWPNCRIPFTIDPALPNQARVTGAIAHWEANTNFRFPPRTTETDFITFRPSTGCSSMVGRQGGQQFVNLAPGCTMGSTIHEIGHVVGLWHEQSRQDRDSFVRINFANIQSGLEHNFNQHISDGDDIGAYDYGSIMHYPRTAFSRNGLDTIVPTNPPSAVIGQRNGLSPGDIAAARSLCPGGGVTIKETVKDVLKDGISDTIKERIKDIRVDTRKEIVLDTLKEAIKDRVKEVALDPIKRLDPIKPGDPVKRDQVFPGIGPLVNPAAGRGAVPFAVGAPHQAPGADPAAASAAADQAAQLDADLQALADALVQAQATVTSLQQQYDQTRALLSQLLDEHDPQG
ncbi:MAG: M12 family metallopeptidase [Acidobacteriota bacterium]